MELFDFPSVVCSCWIECEFFAKALNLSMRLSRKHEISVKLSRKPELTIKLSRKPYVICSLWLLKKNPARRADEKNNLAPILSEKKLSARTKNPKSTNPPNIKWNVPYCVFDSWNEQNTINVAFSLSSTIQCAEWSPMKDSTRIFLTNNCMFRHINEENDIPQDIVISADRG